MKPDFQRYLALCGVRKEDRVLVAFSGGADSTALLLLLLEEASLGRIQEIQAAHLNHGIRGKDAEHDAEFCRNFCIMHEIPFHYEFADVPAYAEASGRSLEDAGRLLRYSFLEKVRKECGCTVIAVAHHKDDQAETVLLHLIRGSGLRGLTGMRYRSGWIVRPLLGYSRNQIEEYLKGLGQEWCSDSTNNDERYTRNQIRCSIIPALRKINPSIEGTLSNLAQNCSEDEDYLEETARRMYSSIYQNNGLVRKKFQALEKPFRIRIIRMELMRLLDCDFTSSDLQRIDDLILNGKNGKEIQLHGKKRVWLENNLIRFGEEYHNQVLCFPFRIGERIPFGERIVYAEEVSGYSVPPEEGTIFLDIESIPPDTVIRNRRLGDRFFPLGAPGDRKLSDYLIDRKVPLRERDNLPLLAAGNRILGIPGYTVSEQAKVFPGTKKIVKISSRRVENHAKPQYES